MIIISNVRILNVRISNVRKAFLDRPLPGGKCNMTIKSNVRILNVRKAFLNKLGLPPNATL